MEMDRSLQVLLLTIFVAMLGLGIVSPILPLYAETFGANYIQVGLLSLSLIHISEPTRPY